MNSEYISIEEFNQLNHLTFKLTISKMNLDSYVQSLLVKYGATEMDAQGRLSYNDLSELEGSNEDERFQASDQRDEGKSKS